MMVMTISKREAKKFLSDAPEEYVFRCTCGRTLRNMQELADELAAMTEEAFAYHVNAEKNDFANWVRDIIGDKRLVEDLMRAKDRVTVAKLTSERVALLRKKSV